MNTKEKTVKVLGEIEYVAITPWGWGSGPSPLTAIRRATSLSDEDKIEGWEKDIHLWMVRKNEWDRIIGEAPANKDGAVGICLYGFIEQPEWRDQIYEALSEAYEKWATAAV